MIIQNGFMRGKPSGWRLLNGIYLGTFLLLGSVSVTVAADDGCCQYATNKCINMQDICTDAQKDWLYHGRCNIIQTKCGCPDSGYYKQGDKCCKGDVCPTCKKDPCTCISPTSCS